MTSDATIHCLPLDILYVVVDRGLSQARYERFGPDSWWLGQPAVDFVVRFSHVCRRWRDFTLATPAFWTRVYFIQHTDMEYKRQVEWIRRSQSALLDIRVDPVPKRRAALSKFPSRIGETLCPHALRWRNLTAMGLSWDFVCPPFQGRGSGSQLPFLESLRWNYSRNAPPSDLTLKSIRDGAPRLETIVIAGEVGIPAVRQLVGCGTSLRRLAVMIGPPSLMEACHQLCCMLPEMASLAELVLYDASDPEFRQAGGGYLPPANRVSLPITSLLARFHVLEFIMDYYDFPALKRVSVIAEPV